MATIFTHDGLRMLNAMTLRQRPEQHANMLFNVAAFYEGRLINNDLSTLDFIRRCNRMMAENRGIAEPPGEGAMETLAYLMDAAVEHFAGAVPPDAEIEAYLRQVSEADLRWLERKAPPKAKG